MPADPARSWSARARWHVAANGVVVAWLGLAGLAAALHGRLGLPGWLALHLFLLGAVTSAIVVWSDHFTRALSHAPDPDLRYAYARLGLLTVGTVGVLAGTAAGGRALAGGGAVLVVAAIGWHTGGLVRTIRRALPTRFGRLAWWYVAACVAVLAGGSLGGLLATGLVPPAWHDGVHLAHAHLNLLGWVGLSVLGTLYVLGPTVLGTTMRPIRFTRWKLAATGGSLAVAVAGLLAGSSLVAAAGVLSYGAGAIWSLSGLLRDAVERLPKSAAGSAFVAAACWLLIALALDAVLLLTGAAARFSLVYAPLLAGFVGQVLVGSLTHLLPVVLGGGPAEAKRLHARFGRAWRLRFAAVNVGIVLALLPLPEPVPTVGWVLLLAALATFAGLAGLTLVERVAGNSAPAVAGALIGVVAILVAAALTVPPTDAVSSGGAARPVDITLRGMRVEPATIAAPAGSRLLLRIVNQDAQRHDLRLATGQRTRLLGTGETATVRTDVLEDKVQGWCTVAGHRAAGMTLTIQVTAAAAAAEEPGQPEHSHSHGSTEAGRDAEPGRTPARNPVLPPATTARTHRVEIRVRETTLEVAPGVTQRMWMYNGTLPGPTLRGRIGDTFVVTLVNAGSIGHGIDFHAGALAPDQPMRTIDPGERLTYTFRATRAGAWLYHCSTAPISQHLANGMYGAVIIDPPGLAKVDREYVMVAGELYRGVPGSPGQVAKIRSGQPDGWMFNGRTGQYDETPLTARAGERVRFWVVDAGPGSTTAFHVVGTVFDTVYKEGAYLLRPAGDDGGGGAQVLDLAPAQGGFVEAEFPEAGHYPFVDHDLRHAEAGAHGLVTVGP
ncbi:multicopper oxidase domain-containing protein [Flindersiella endophytica]